MNRMSQDYGGAKRLDNAAAIVARTRELAPMIEAAAPRIEAERALTAEVLAALHGAGLFRMLLPRSCGGAEVAPAVLMQTIVAIAKADASTAWCISQGSGVSMAAAYLKPAIAREIFGGERAVLASGTAATPVPATIVDDGYRVTGTWRFASGCKHADWLGGHCILGEADGTPRLGPNGAPIERTVLFPKAHARFTDTWHVIGLKGTGSDSYSVDDLFVPADYSFTRESAADRRETGPLYRFTTYNMFGIGFASVALGIGRAAFDAFIRLAGEKVPYLWRNELRENAVIQSQVGMAEARLQSARGLLLQILHELWESASQGQSFTRDQQAALRLASTYATHQAKDVLDFVYHAAGASAIFASNPFERRFRDIHTVTQQVQANASNFELVGQHLLGLEARSKLL